MALVVFLPLNVKAAESISIGYNCKEADGNGIINCTATYQILDDAMSEATITLTEQGGAQVVSVETAPGSEWSVVDTNEAGNVWTIKLESIGITGDGDLFTFSYRPSGTDDCKIQISHGITQTTIVPPQQNDEPTDNKQTGATLPYIALGIMVVGAAGAYIAVRNKAKMYRL